jgi:type I restriction enzyme R subunit
MEVKEKRFEQDIESWLLKYGGYTKGDLSTYDRSRAIDLTKLISFIKETQPKQWDRYVNTYKGDAERKLFKRFHEEVETNGLLHVIRHGIKDRGIKIDIAYFRNETTLNPEVVKKYESNILTCTRQFKYSTENENSIDMVLSLNGIPIVAIELKDQLTGQTIDHAKRQFMFDRNPKEHCFHLNRRFLVYFAVDLYEIEIPSTKVQMALET